MEKAGFLVQPFLLLDNCETCTIVTNDITRFNLMTTVFRHVVNMNYHDA